MPKTILFKIKVLKVNIYKKETSLNVSFYYIKVFKGQKFLRSSRGKKDGW